MTELVSTLMPAYNSAKYIGEAIESVLNQQYDTLELIIGRSVGNTNIELVAGSTLYIKKHTS